ncbi:unnamed protein product [Linum trigynum]|uniref:Uncharacterized protein n=1 Tax=Linum trigynum TaxID=586398 RepID=A0AAV2GEP1_9ROSI
MLPLPLPFFHLSISATSSTFYHHQPLHQTLFPILVSLLSPSISLRLLSLASLLSPSISASTTRSGYPPSPSPLSPSAVSLALREESAEDEICLMLASALYSASNYKSAASPLIRAPKTGTTT